MRPNYLKMTGFGPYKDTVEINLDTLGERGIYLITGNTGAGKTTIFDAITFALYGSPSGKNRDAAMFRSKFAGPDTATEVELIFTNNEKQYRIVRCPAYERLKSRGEGTTMSTAKAELIYPDGHVVTGSGNVDAAVRDIIGVDKNQFCQIVMLAQGAFLEMLFADTAKRTEIFRNIFRTDRFQVLQDRLKREAMTLSNGLADGRKKIQTLIGTARCDENDSLFIDLEKAQRGELLTEDILELLDRLMARGEARRTDITSRLNICDSEIYTLTEKIAKGEERDKAVRQLSDSEKSLEELIPLYEAAEKAYRVAEADTAKAEEAAQAAAGLRSRLSGYDELEEERKQAEIEAQNAKRAEADKALADRSVEEDTACQQKLAEELAELKDTAAQVVALMAEKERLLKLSEDYSALKADMEKTARLTTELLELQKDFAAKLKASDEAGADYNDKNALYLAEQAGILAETLEEGRPCPVCGATEHPSPARKSQEAPTKEQLERAKRAAERAADECNKASQAAAAKKGEKETGEGHLIKAAEALFGSHVEIGGINAVYMEKKAQHESAIALCEDKLSAAKARDAQRNRLEKKIPELTQNIEKNKAYSQEAALRQVKAEEAGKKAVLRVESLVKTLEFSSKKEALDRVRTLEKTAEDITEAKKKALAQFDGYKDRRNKLQGNIDAIKKQLENIVATDLEADREKQSSLKTERAALQKFFTDITSEMNANAAAKQGILLASDSIRDIERKYAYVKPLTDTATGQISGKDKIDLETYVQTFYFDRIVQRANLRFLGMTDGHYELKRGNATDKKSKAGLDLSIIDHYNGAERSVKSLSGGESFEAALSLALGLADEIQESAGGIHLDTLFVDEGFGSLDEEALNKAMRALEALSSGNRLVGIISHVQALKERIDHKIVVTKQPTGESSVRIV